jgi:hypothetical protein
MTNLGVEKPVVSETKSRTAKPHAAAKAPFGKTQAVKSAPAKLPEPAAPAAKVPEPPAAAAGQRLVAELKVSGHLMTLDSGLFCIFNAPGSAAPDQGSGLPGVRISLPPGPMFRPDAVAITSFREDGWLGGWNGAALVRVTRGPAQILVTIYQAPNSTAEAPRLQVLRLTDSANLPAGTQPPAMAPSAPMPMPGMAPPPAAPAPARPAPPVAAKPAAPPPPPAAAPQNTPSAVPVPGEAAKTAEMIAHIQGRGDVLAKLGEWMGEPGSQRWVEGFALAPRGKLGPNDIEYQAVLGRGWLSPWAEGGQYCGSRGMSLPILGLRVRLRGEAAERYDCRVEASFVDGTKIGPLDNGEPCQAASLSPLEAFHIKLIPHAEAAAAPREKPAAKPKPKPKR